VAADRGQTAGPPGRGGLARRLPAGGDSAARVGDPSEQRDGTASLASGLDALAGGQWERAAAALARAAGTGPPVDESQCRALEGLSEALWWLGRVDEALGARARAYEGWRAAGDDLAAARVATWLAREYRAAVGNPAASRGWLARAETLATGADAAEVAGWVALTRAQLAADPQVRAAAARDALARARETRSGDLEVLALGQLGLATVAAGRPDDGLDCLDEAMAAATGGEAGLSTLAALCCDLVLASELSGEIERFAQWNEIVETLAVRHGHPSLVAFCATCCAEAFATAGDWSGAEQQLRAGLTALQATGHRARCVAPAAKLADLLVSQGRLEEAEAVLEADDETALLVRARLALARSDAATAVLLAERHCRRLGGPSLLTAPALALLVDAHLAAGALDRAQAEAERLQTVAELHGHRRTRGRAALARARLAIAAGDPATGRDLLEVALDHLAASAPGAVETAQARLDLARLCADEAVEHAVAEAKAALVGFEAAGAAHAADAAAAVLRELGDRSRVGPKRVGTLTRREQDVLRLVAQGLTNAEIAERLFISPKTAGNHVSHILAKLGLRSRVEAAAHAARRPGT
jgi:DNA-binding CsgD family transcriptional regulator